MFRPRRVNRAVLCVSVLSLGSVALAAAQEVRAPPAPLPPAQEELLAELSPETPLPDSCIVSPDGKRFACRAKRGKNWLVILDGKEGVEFEEVRTPVFSPDGQHLAYWGKREKKKGRDSSGAEIVSYREVIVVDGKEGPEFEDVSWPVFSPDGQHLAYGASRKKNHEVIVLDGKESLEFEEVGVPFLSWNPSLVAAIFPMAGYEREVGVPVFSPDSRHLAYRAKRDKKREVVIVDTKEGPEFEEVGGPVFSADGRHLAYRAKRGKRWLVILDGKEGAEFEHVGRPVFNPDGQHLAYWAKRGKKYLLVLDGKEQEGPKAIGILAGPLFSVDGQHVASIVWQGGKSIEVRDGKATIGPKLPSSSFIGAGLMFSPDGQRLAYVLHYLPSRGFLPKMKTRAVVDGETGKEYKEATIPEVIFSPDSRHFAYAVYSSDKGKSLCVLDGKEGKLYDEVSELGFSGSNSVTYVAREARKFYRVTQPVP